MAQYLSLLMLPKPGPPVPRDNKDPIRPNEYFADADRQAEKIEPLWLELQASFEQKRISLAESAVGTQPEEVLVLECIGAVVNFTNAVKKIPGLEWLIEDLAELQPDSDFYNLKHPDKKLNGRLFLMFTNRAALDQLYSMWKAFRKGEKLPKGLAPFKEAFSLLSNIRPWGIQDRLKETGLLEYWKDRAAEGQTVGLAELELWPRDSELSRRRSEKKVRELVESAGGKVVKCAFIAEIEYHAILAELPIGLLLDPDKLSEVSLLHFEGIQYIRPTPQLALNLDSNFETEPGERAKGTLPNDSNPIVAALLDGLPMVNHGLLRDHLVLDDPDDYGSEYSAEEQKHGTAMASAIIHGDLNTPKHTIGSRLYARPILKPDARAFRTPRPEIVPADQLLPDLLRSALARMKDEKVGVLAAPDVAVVNLSIGDANRPFLNLMSPTARMLDWLSYRYKVLFLVSAGNCTNDIAIPDQSGDDSQIALGARFIRHLFDERRNRRLLSPGESVNSLTIGALNSDDGEESSHSPPLIDPLRDHPFLSVLSPSGPGYARAIKPDLFFPGGRQLLEQSGTTNGFRRFKLVTLARPPGIKTASSRVETLNQRPCYHTRGTSNATALATRAAIILSEELRRLEGKPGSKLLKTIPLALWLKTLLVHAASWNSAEEKLKEILQEKLPQRRAREYCGQLLGFGAFDPSRCGHCQEYRATGISGGHLRADGSDCHHFPIPDELSGIVGMRRLTVVSFL